VQQQAILANASGANSNALISGNGQQMLSQSALNNYNTYNGLNKNSKMKLNYDDLKKYLLKEYGPA
jgi:hypothetical protein